MGLISWTQFERGGLGGLGDAGRPSFVAKTFGVTKSAPWANYGASNPAATQTTGSSKEYDRFLRVCFDKYSSQHPFRPTKAALTNPSKMYVERKLWMEKCRKAIFKMEKTDNPAMLAKGWYGQTPDKKMRRGAHLSSSWITGAKLIDPHHLSLRLGGRDYTYGISDYNALSKFLSCASMGNTVARLRKLQSGSTVNGLTKL